MCACVRAKHTPCLLFPCNCLTGHRKRHPTRQPLPISHSMTETFQIAARKLTRQLKLTQGQEEELRLEFEPHRKSSTCGCSVQTVNITELVCEQCINKTHLLFSLCLLTTKDTRVWYTQPATIVYSGSNSLAVHVMKSLHALMNWHRGHQPWLAGKKAYLQLLVNLLLGFYYQSHPILYTRLK